VNQAIEECEAESARGEPPAPTAAKGFVEFPGKEDSEETLREGKKTMATLRSTAAAGDSEARPERCCNVSRHYPAAQVYLA
jgi:hypothetical protein